MAPLTVVAPIGVLALGLTAVITTRLSGAKLNRGAALAIGARTIGVVAFLLLYGRQRGTGEIAASALAVCAVIALATDQTSRGDRFCSLDRVRWPEASKTPQARVQRVVCRAKCHSG